MPVNADEKNWDMEVKLYDVKKMNIKGVGTFYALEAVSDYSFREFFVKQNHGMALA